MGMGDKGGGGEEGGGARHPPTRPDRSGSTAGLTEEKRNDAKIWNTFLSASWLRCNQFSSQDKLLDKKRDE